MGKPAASQLMTRRAMMAGTLGLGVAASNGAAVAAEGTPQFRPTMPSTKQAIPGIPKTVDGAAMPETISPDFLPKAAVLAGVLTRIDGLGKKIDAQRGMSRAARLLQKRRCSVDLEIKDIPWTTDVLTLKSMALSQTFDNCFSGSLIFTHAKW